jgi:transposase
VVSEVVLAELGDGDRFGSLKEATAYAGLVPGKRDSDGKGKELGITKKGSRLLRWAMVEAAWVAVSHSARWRGCTTP